MLSALPPVTGQARESSTVAPLTTAAVTGTNETSCVSVKASAGAVVAERVSL